MPLIQVKVFEGELNQEQSKELVSQITDAVCEVTSERLRDATCVLIEEVKSGYWGIGGEPLGLDDVQAIVARE